MGRAPWIPALFLALAATALAPATASAASWCGNDVATADRLPEAVSGAQFHVVYAVPSDGADRFSETAPKIVTDLEHVVGWWRGQDATRQPRFDLFAFPTACTSELARLDLSFARLSAPAAAYAPSANRFPLIREELSRAGFADPAKKYLVYYDGEISADDVCGTGGGQARVGGPFSYAIVWVRAQAACGSVGNGDYAAVTAVHELLHSLGAVPPAENGAGPPHACAGDDGHVCGSAADVMASFGVSNAIGDYVLDADRDDYYGHGGSWFDIRTSLWLRHLDAAEQPLTVTIVGAGEGDGVESALPGISCPTACAIGWEAGTEVELEARSGEGNTAFRRWEGACAGGDATCTVRVDGPAAVRAVFGPASYPLTLRVRGNGRIAGDAACRTTCRFAVDYPERTRLRAVAAKGWRFVGWGGACRGAKACVVTATAARAVTATFARRRG
jgi:hypothetical protein